MSQEIATRRGVQLYVENPFMVNINSKTKRITNKRGDMVLVSNQGEVVSNIAGFWESEEVDGTKFIKLFVNGVRALAELSNAGARVFEILYIEMQNNIGKDQVYLSFTAIDNTVTDISRATFKRGLAELIDKKFIAAMPAVGWYWVNPDFIWNGDRLAFVKEYKKASIKKTIQKDTKTIDMFTEET